MSSPIIAATTTPPPPVESNLTLLDDEDYNSAEDDDFDPTAVAAEADVSGSDSDSREPRKKRKRRVSDSSVESFGNDSGGEGGLIKTRAQRAKERFEKPRLGGVLASANASTTDVDELWRQMNSKPTKPAPAATPEPVTVENPEEKEEVEKKEGEIKVNAEGEETITISRAYTFAGTTYTELKTVPRYSHEASTYLADVSITSPTSTPATATPPIDYTLPPRRPPPKKRASVFDAAAAARKPAIAAAAQKMNTLEKSRLDWAGFVDKEGISEELKKHTRGDKAYLDRQAFLGRVEENRDRAWKEGQKK